MANKQFSLTLNGNPVAGLPSAVEDLLETVTLIDNPLADSIQKCLDRKVVPADADENSEPVALRNFFIAEFNDPDRENDVFQVSVTHDNGDSYVSAPVSRKVIANRLYIATNIADYRIEVTKNVTKKAASEKGSSKAAPRSVRI